MTKKAKQFMKLSAMALIIIFSLSLLWLNQGNNLLLTVFSSNEELVANLEEIFKNRNIAIVNEEFDLIKPLYDTNTKYGKWAYEYEQIKSKYIHNWEQKQGVIFIGITTKILVKNIKKYENKYTVNLQSIIEYKYVYNSLPNGINVSKIGTNHVIELISKDGKWIIGKEWYKDPFGDYLNLGNLKVDDVKEFITSQQSRDFSNIGERRLRALEYADKYNGASNDEQFEFRYNKKYRNYNPQGGDCANFASQVLFEGGKFRKTSGWNYNVGGATRAWVNADGFTRYMLNSGRASLIARGNYQDVYKQSYKLLPGDFIAYEEKGDISHVSVVTGADSMGYTLVSCHNTDRNRVPWDLGWSGKNIKFWLVRVHY